MTYKEAAEILKLMPKQSEAISLSIEALEKAERYKWHDLRKDPEDLPDSRRIVLAFDAYVYGTAFYSGNEHFGWIASGKDVDSEEIIAWRYIEPLEEEE